jgi:hypothetical protein
MPVSEISAGLTSLKAAVDIVKAMVGLRDAEAFRLKSIELTGLIMDGQAKLLEAQALQFTHIDRIRSLETEITKMKEWDAEKQNYELKQLWTGAMTYMRKPDARGVEPAHWLCPNCYTEGRKSFFQPTDRSKNRIHVYSCSTCKGEITSHNIPSWEQGFA